MTAMHGKNFDPEDKFMILDELANELIRMYEDAEERESSLMIRLFGIRYADIIRENKYTATDIIKQANDKTERISESYITEISKGIALAKYVIDKQKLIDFINSTGM